MCTFILDTYICQNHMILTLGPMVSHNQKSHVTYYSECRDLRNAMVSFMMIEDIPL